MTEHEQEVLRQVQADVPRTAPDMKLFRNHCVQSCLEKLLFTWAMRHPASSYVQGMNDLAIPLFAVFLGDNCNAAATDNLGMNDVSDQALAEVEADTYWCLSAILVKIQDHYTPDQPGIQRMNFRLEELIERVDPELSSHFKEQGIEICLFTFKWMNCLLVRELPLHCLIRVWDTYLSEEERGFDAFHVNVCAACLKKFSTQLKTMNYDEIFFFVQNLPTSDWGDEQVEMLLSQAFVWQSSLEEILDREIIMKDPQLSRSSSFKLAIQRAVETTSTVNIAQKIACIATLKQATMETWNTSIRITDFLSH
eukprot:CAMPEP_0172507918 /NCGR_PEP_ID=MMETSP1066-20121228/207651_1 /TAXON_ID=671091 /ORGANISM="Coscinodiscus wailesii, Strain CCMP2513" /LENGTH=308 /DNA_ID=CAMNT_0013285651 /DNA_START=313 /DNA_END=1239 /DNA_ORIENTATION=+